MPTGGGVVVLDIHACTTAQDVAVVVASIVNAQSGSTVTANTPVSGVLTLTSKTPGSAGNVLVSGTGAGTALQTQTGTDPSAAAPILSSVDETNLLSPLFPSALQARKTQVTIQSFPSLVLMGLGQTLDSMANGWSSWSFANNGGVSTWAPQNTDTLYNGATYSGKISLANDGANPQLSSAAFAAIDMTNKHFRLVVQSSLISALKSGGAHVVLYAFSAYTSSYFTFTISEVTDGSVMSPLFPDGSWAVLEWPWVPTQTIGSPDRTAITQLRITVYPATGATSSFYLGELSIVNEPNIIGPNITQSRNVSFPATTKSADVVSSSCSVVASALPPTNTTMSIVANSIDVPRKLQVYVVTGSNAGAKLTLVGINTNGQTVSQLFDISTTGAGTVNTRDAYASLTSVTTSGITAAAGTVGIGLGAALGLPTNNNPPATGFSIYKEIANGTNETVGTVDTKAMTVAPTTAADGAHSYEFWYNFGVAPTSNGMLVLTMDDAFASQYTVALPALQARVNPDGSPLSATLYLIDDFIGASGRLSLTQLRTMRDNGIEPQMHAHYSNTHSQPRGFASLSASAQLADLTAMMAYHRANELGFSHLAFPLGFYDQNLLNAMSSLGIYTGRTLLAPITGTFLENNPPSQRNRLRSITVTNTTVWTPSTPGNVQYAVDEAVAAKVPLIVTLHDFVASAPSISTQILTSNLTWLLDYAISKGMLVVSVTRAFGG